jgi:hypothetical protein
MAAALCGDPAAAAPPLSLLALSAAAAMKSAMHISAVCRARHCADTMCSHRRVALTRCCVAVRRRHPWAKQGTRSTVSDTPTEQMW